MFVQVQASTDAGTAGMCGVCDALDVLLTVQWHFIDRMQRWQRFPGMQVAA